MLGFDCFQPKNVKFSIFFYPRIRRSTTFAISGKSSFTCASVRSMSVTTDSICITAMRVGRALAYI